MQEIKSCTYTFTDESIEYQDDEKTYKVKWSVFKPSLILEDNILLFIKGSESASFMLNKEEIGEQNFLEVCEILKEKIEPV